MPAWRIGSPAWAWPMSIRFMAYDQIVDNPKVYLTYFPYCPRFFVNQGSVVSTIVLNELKECLPGDETVTLSDHVFSRIQSAIVKGEIMPGSKISEPELARTYGISRGPLREALHRLEGQRLLVRVPHAGARVVALSHAELIELYEIRESLEGMACRLAAERMSHAELDELRQVLDTHERDAAFQAGVGYYQQEGDFDFHYRIIQGSGNQMLKRMLCDELYQLVRMYRLRFSATPNRPRQAFNEHHRILDALVERDGELAELLMRRHIAASKRNIQRHFHSGAVPGALANPDTSRGEP